MLRSSETNQYAGLQLRAEKTMCGQKCHITKIPDVVVCVLEEEQLQGNFNFWKDLGSNLEATQLLSRLGFLHLDTNQRMQDQFMQTQSELCELELANYRTKLQTLAGTNNPYTLLNQYGWATP